MEGAVSSQETPQACFTLEDGLITALSPKIQLCLQNSVCSKTLISRETVLVSNTNVKITSKFILLEKNPSRVGNDEEEYPIRILRITALKLIKKWLQKSSPSVSKWQELIEQIKDMKKLTLKLEET